MATHYTLWTTCLALGVFLLWLTACQCKDLYVDSAALEEDAPCTKQHPCRTLQHAVNHSAPGDILLLAFGKGYQAYIITTLSIPWNLTIKAGKALAVPLISCQAVMSTCNINVRTSDPAVDITEVTFEDINIKGCDLCFRNASVSFNQVILKQADLTVEARNDNQVIVNNSTFNDTTLRLSGVCNKPSVDVGCNFTSLTLNMKDTSLFGETSSLNLSNISDVVVILENVQFRGFNNQVKLSSTTTLKLDITNMQLVDFITDAAGFALDLTKGDLVGSIVDSYFENNTVLIGGALSLTTGNTSRMNLTIKDTVFRNNSCVTAGGAMNLDLAEHYVPDNDHETILPLMMQNIHIDGCNFTRNENQESAAGIYMAGGNVTITGSSFIENTVTTALSMYTRRAERKGAGGAIYGTTASYIEIDECTFIDNSANWFGGAVAGEGAVRITNSYFETNRSAHSTLGEVLYLSGPVRMGNLTFNIVVASSNVPLIWYSGSKSSVLQGVGDGFLNFHCPVGSQFKNNSLPELDVKAMYRDLFYFCEPCHDDTYSLLHGYRSGPLDSEAGNWSSDFKCLPCAYGAVCKGGRITSQFNFWGHTAGDPPQVSMLMCPENYCCNDAKCDAYNTCAGNRSGTLCGRCREGMSELLYTTECVDNQKCNDVWVFAVDLITASVTLVFFLYQLEIVAVICKYLFWADVSENDDPTFAGFIKSIFYFYQTVDLLKVQENQASKIVGVAIQPVVSYLLSFQSIAIIFGACPFPGMNPVTKTVIKSMPTLYVLSFLGILTLIYTIVQLRKKQQEPSPYVHFQRRSSTAPVTKRTFGSRLAAACLSYFLFNYISISNMTFTLLSCTPVGDQSVLFIDGTVQCIQPWQSVFILVAIIHVCPFFMAVIVSRYLYDRDLISTRQFFLSYFLPLPMLFYWAVVYCTKWKGLKGLIIEDAMHDSAIDEPMPSLSQDELMKVSILGMIEEPFVNHTNAESARYWEGILIFRRLVLSAIAAFTVQPLLSITLQTMVCFAFLLWHVHIHPFGSKAANYFETTSLSILSVIGMYHMIQATLLSSGIPAIGPNKTQIFITDWIEWILVSLFPMLLGLAFIVFLFIRLFMAIGSGFKYLCQRARDSRDRSEYSSPF